MPGTRAWPTAAKRLRATARKLGYDREPYYLHTPNGPAEPAPGWYWRAAGATHPEYLGYNHIDAEIALRDRLRARQDAA